MYLSPHAVWRYVLQLQVRSRNSLLPPSSWILNSLSPGWLTTALVAGNCLRTHACNQKKIKRLKKGYTLLSLFISLLNPLSPWAGQIPMLLNFLELQTVCSERNLKKQIGSGKWRCLLKVTQSVKSWTWASTQIPWGLGQNSWVSDRLALDDSYSLGLSGHIP